MPSFGQLALKMREAREEPGQDFWDDQGEEDEERLKEFVKRGLELRPERSDGLSFWDDFMLLFGQNSGLGADLLGVRQEAISRAMNKVRKLQNDVRKENDHTEKKRKKNTMLHTGDRL